MTPNDFPYIKAIHVNDCFAYKNFDIALPNLNGKPFSHLILTGKNGSGKTTILRGVEQHVGLKLFGNNASIGYYSESSIRAFIERNTAQKLQWNSSLLINKSVSIAVNDNKNFEQFKGKLIFSFFKANRYASGGDVHTITKNDTFSDKLITSGASDQHFALQFKQYLVNKKVEQAFEQLKNNTLGIRKIEQFFENFIQILKHFFEDNSLQLIFEDKEFEFYVILKDSRKITFNQMSEGFSAFISILVDLLIRVDLIRSAVNDNTYDPCGIVLLDEPETHLHIKAQYEVLPILTEFFPNVQFIVATHSPAVISSIKNTTIFDLTSQNTVTDEVVGSSFSELMVTHFGLDNEFSPIADEIIHNVEKVIEQNKSNKPLLKQKLQEILRGNERYLSPVLQLELQSLISENR
jgi:predicted ATP-binding protein involved in virulence